MTNTFPKFDREFRQGWEFGDGYEALCAGHEDIAPVTRTRLGAFLDWVPLVVRIAICLVRGHNIVVEGYATPESGREDWCCTRCGDGGHHTYY